MDVEDQIYFKMLQLSFLHDIYRSENGTSSMDSLTATELKSRLLDYFHGDYIALVRFFR